MPTQLGLFVGQTAANGQLTWSEAGIPADAALVSDNPAVCPGTLNADGTWTAGPAAAAGVANFTITGTSAAPERWPGRFRSDGCDGDGSAGCGDRGLRSRQRNPQSIE